MKIATRPFASLPGGQTDFWNDWTSRLLFLEGGWGSGKTWIGARKLLAATLFNAIDTSGPRPRKTGVEAAMIGPSYRTVADFMLPAFEEACTEWGVKYRWHSKDSWYVLPQFGCKVRARTAERPDMITGWQVGCAWGDEPARWKEDRGNPKDDPYLQLLGRVRGPGKLHQVYFTYTNEGDHTRIYEEAHSTLPGRARYRAHSKDNPTIADFYKYQMATLTPALADQYLAGGAAHIGGTMAYADQLSDDNFAPRVSLVVGRPLQLALDFNISPGMHGYIGQYLDDHDVFAVAHEMHGPRMNVRQLVIEFGKWIGQQGGFRWSHLEIFGDATGKSEWAGTGESQYDILAQGLRELDLRRHDDKEKVDIVFRVPASNPPKVDRVNAVNVALLDMAGERHVVISRQCERLRDDLEKCRWDKTGKAMETGNPALTHPTDAIGYWIHYLRPIRRYVEGVGGRVGV